MLDTLADAWAADNDGANIWADPTRDGSSTRSPSPACSSARSPVGSPRVWRTRSPTSKSASITSSPSRSSASASPSSPACSPAAASTARSGPTARTRSPSRSRPRTATSGSSASSTPGSDGRVPVLRRQPEDPRPRRGPRNPRLRVHPHRRHQGSDRRAVRRRHAVRRHHRQPAVPARRRRVWRRSATPIYQLFVEQAMTLDPRFARRWSPRLGGSPAARVSTSFASRMLADERVRNHRRLPEALRRLPRREDSRRRLATSSGTATTTARATIQTMLGRRAIGRASRPLPRRVTTCSSAATRPCSILEKVAGEVGDDTLEPDDRSPARSRSGSARIFQGKPTAGRARRTPSSCSDQQKVGWIDASRYLRRTPPGSTSGRCS